MRIFGLIGKNINYSYSATIFKKKFQTENITDAKYQIFDIKNIEIIKDLLYKIPNLSGLNITIPYKEKILSLIHNYSNEVLEIGAVNTIKILSDQKMIGYNTDIYGFEKSFLIKKKQHHKNALILGTGGAAKAIAFVLKKLNISYLYVSRNKKKNSITYLDITHNIINNYQIIINCSPIGTYPNIDQAPILPYQSLSSIHYMYDLIYNPYETSFLKKGKHMGCTIQNGLNMLHFQADKSWQIWNQENK